MVNFNINAIFKDNFGEELNLYSIGIDESLDSINIITEVRQPILERGSVGDLIFVSKTPLDSREIRDIHRDVSLQRIEVWSEEVGEPTQWRYIFLKN